MKTENENQTKNIIGYVRVSTTDQVDTGASLETQKESIIKKVKDLKGNLVEIFEDGGKSGTNMNRPGLKAMLARCSAGGINLLIISDTSRLSRDTKDYLAIRAILEKYKVEITALSGVCSFGDNPYDKFLDEIIASVNALHPRVSGFKAKETCMAKFNAGYYPSCGPIGYKNIKNKNPTGSYDKRIIVIDKKTAPFVINAFKLYATGDHSIYSVRQYLHSNGVKGKLGKDLHYSAVYNMLRCSFYYGVMKWSKMEKIGKHKPLIDKSTFDIVQRILKEKGDFGIRKRKHYFLLSGIAFCKDCGRRYVAEWHFGERFEGGKIGYYHCNGKGRLGTYCKAPNVRIEELEYQAELEISKLSFKKSFVEAVKRNIKLVYQDSISKNKSAKKALQNKKTEIERKQERLEDELLSGTVSREVYKRLSIKTDSELTMINQELAKAEQVKTLDIKVVEEVLFFTRDIVKAYREGDPHQKKAYLKFFFKKFLIKDKEIVEVEYQPIIDVVNKAKNVIVGERSPSTK